MSNGKLKFLTYESLFPWVVTTEFFIQIQPNWLTMELCSCILLKFIYIFAAYFYFHLFSFSHISYHLNPQLQINKFENVDHSSLKLFTQFSRCHNSLGFPPTFLLLLLILLLWFFSPSSSKHWRTQSQSLVSPAIPCLFLAWWLYLVPCVKLYCVC